MQGGCVKKYYVFTATKINEVYKSAAENFLGITVCHGINLMRMPVFCLWRECLYMVNYNVSKHLYCVHMHNQCWFWMTSCFTCPLGNTVTIQVKLTFLGAWLLIKIYICCFDYKNRSPKHAELSVWLLIARALWKQNAFVMPPLHSSHALHDVTTI